MLNFVNFDSNYFLPQFSATILDTTYDIYVDRKDEENILAVISAPGSLSRPLNSYFSGELYLNLLMDTANGYIVPTFTTPESDLAQSYILTEYGTNDEPILA